jgi:hypothetical protein
MEAADAEDATQEILIRVVTRLASWRGEATLLTWAYRIGVNYLLNLRRQTPQETSQLSLEQFRDDLADGLAAADYRGPEAALLAQESSPRRTRRGYSRPAPPRTASGCSGRGAAAVLRAHPDYAAPRSKVDAITALLHSGRFPLLETDP